MAKVKQDPEVSSLDSTRQHDENYVDPENLSDDAVIEAFFSQLVHPSTGRSSEELARYVELLLSETSDQPPKAVHAAWRKRMIGMSVDVDELEDDELDGWLDNDTPMAAIYAVLRASRDNEKMISERTALLLLRNLRAGVLRRDEVSEVTGDEWIQLIGRLSAKARSH